MQRRRRRQRELTPTPPRAAAGPAAAPPPPPPPGRLLVFAVLYVSYAGYYLCKKNFAFWLGHVVQEFDVSLARAGALGSAFELSSGAAKVFLAVWVDTRSPRLVLSGALLVSVLVNVAMWAVSHAAHAAALSGDSALLLMAVLWGCNGCCQALGWPALARIFMAWFEPNERGRWYSLLSTNQNAGSAIVPLLIAPATELSGSWRVGGFLAPAFAGLAIAALVVTVLSDEPPTSTAPAQRRRPSTHGRRGQAPPEPEPEPELEPEAVPLSELLAAEVFSNPAVYLLGLCYMCVSILRSGLGDWAVQFLQDRWGMDDNGASSCIVMMELGGFAGSLGAGIISDVVFGGRRAPVIGGFAALTVIPLALLSAGGGHANAASRTSWLFCFGWLNVPQLSFLLFGVCSFAPHVLIGLAAREWCGKRPFFAPLCVL